MRSAKPGGRHSPSEDDWAYAAAHIAWAEIALHAEQPDVALVALAHARALEPESLSVQRSVRRLLEEIARSQKHVKPEQALVQKLALLSR